MVTHTQITGPFNNGYLDYKREIYEGQWIAPLFYGASKIYTLFNNIRVPGEALKVDSVRLPVMSEAIINTVYNDLTGQKMNMAIEGTVEFAIREAINVYERMGHTGNKLNWITNKIQTFVQQEAIIKDDLIFERLNECVGNGATEINLTDTIDKNNVNKLLGFFKRAYSRHTKKMKSVDNVAFFIDYDLETLLQSINVLSGSMTIEGTAITVRKAFGYNLIPCDLKNYGFDILSTPLNNIFTFEQVYNPISSGIIPSPNQYAGHQYIQYLEVYDVNVVDKTLVFFHKTKDAAQDTEIRTPLSNILKVTDIGTIRGATPEPIPTADEIILMMRIANNKYNLPEAFWNVDNITATSATVSNDNFDGTVDISFTYNSTVPDIDTVITITNLGEITGSTTATIPVAADIIPVVKSANSLEQADDTIAVTSITETSANIMLEDFEGKIKVTYTYTPAAAPDSEDSE
jgi:hypothetical protein